MARKPLTSAERSYYYNAIRYVDSQQEYVICDASTDSLSYTDRINSKESIHGRPTDEELTRALIVVNLINNYGYTADKLILEDTVEVSGRFTVQAIYE